MATRVLVTNDDGIDGPGLRVLVAALVDHGYEPIVVAPDADYSGAGTSVISHSATEFSGGKRELPYQKRVLEEAPDVEAYAIGAPPAMCALLSMRGAFGERPDLVASGINFGLNTGQSVRHSGTVSAAITAASFGVPSIALSAQFVFDEPDTPLRYDTAAAVGIQLLPLLAASDHLVLNVNVPRLGIEELAGIRAASICPVASFYSQVEDRTDEVLKIGYAISGEAMPEGTDSALIQDGFAAVSALHGVMSVDCSDIISGLEDTAT